MHHEAAAEMLFCTGTQLRTHYYNHWLVGAIATLGNSGAPGWATSCARWRRHRRYWDDARGL